MMTFFLPSFILSLQITDSEIPVSKDEGKHKGFAFLMFEKSESVTNIVKDPYHYIKGKVLQVVS